MTQFAQDFQETLAVAGSWTFAPATLPDSCRSRPSIFRRISRSTRCSQPRHAGSSVRAQVRFAVARHEQPTSAGPAQRLSRGLGQRLDHQSIALPFSPRAASFSQPNSSRPWLRICSTAGGEGQLVYRPGDPVRTRTEATPSRPSPIPYCRSWPPVPSCRAGPGGAVASAP